jgi:hypothetical protein
VRDARADTMALPTNGSTMTNSLKHSLLSTVDEFLRVLGLERRYSLSRRMTPGVGWLIVGAAAGGATAAWLMSGAGQEFIQGLRGSIQKTASDLQTQRHAGNNGVAAVESSAPQAKASPNRTHPRTVA